MGEELSFVRILRSIFERIRSKTPKNIFFFENKITGTKFFENHTGSSTHSGPFKLYLRPCHGNGPKFSRHVFSPENRVTKSDFRKTRHEISEIASRNHFQKVHHQ